MGFVVLVYPLMHEYFNFENGYLPNGVTHKEHLELEKQEN